LNANNDGRRTKELKPFKLNGTHLHVKYIPKQGMIATNGAVWRQPRTQTSHRIGKVTAHWTSLIRGWIDQGQD